MPQHLTDDSFQDVPSKEEEEDFPTAVLDMMFGWKNQSQKALMHP